MDKDPFNDDCLNFEARRKYTIALMLWGHERAFEYKRDQQYPTYYQYECGLSNPGDLQEQLFREQFYQEAAFCEIFETYTMNELKVIADSIGIPKTGKKADLIQRILCNSSPDELHCHIRNKKYFVLSNKGKAYLHSYYDYIIFHRYNKYHISIEEYEAAKKQLQSSECETVLIYLMCQRVQKNRFDVLGYIHLKELYDNTKQYEKAMLTFLLLIYFDVNCLSLFSWYYEDTTYYSHEFAKENMVRHIHQQDFLNMHQAAYFSKNIEFFKPDMVDYIFCSYPLNFVITDKNMFLEILEDMKKCTFFNTRKWNKLIYQNLISICKEL